MNFNRIMQTILSPHLEPIQKKTPTPIGGDAMGIDKWELLMVAGGIYLFLSFAFCQWCSERWDLQITAAAQTPKNSPSSRAPLRLDINNKLCSGCYDNGIFIAFKPRRGSQLVCAAPAVRTEYAGIGSPRLPTPNYPPPATHRFTKATSFRDIEMHFHYCR